MDLETLEATGYENGDVLVDFPGSELVSLEFPNTAFNSMDYDTMEPGTIGLASLHFCSAGTHSTRFDLTNSGSTESGHISFCGNPWATTDSGMSGLYATGFCSLESDTTHRLTADSDTTAPVTIAGHRIDAKRLDSNKMYVPVANYDPIESHNLNSGTDRINNLAVQQRQSSSQGWQASSTAGQFSSTNNGACHSQDNQTSLPHPTLPKQASFRSDNWREYQPRSLDVYTTRAKITADDWEDHRPFIEHLYLVENVKLKDVMQIMETKFSFAAT